MKFSYEAFLNKQEEVWTRKRKRRQNKPIPLWLAPFYPDQHLSPAEVYPIRLYIQAALVLVLFFALIEVVLWAILLLALFGPSLLYHLLTYHDLKHRVFIGILSHEGLYFAPFVLIAAIILSLLIFWPRYYFWNRRAARLRRLGQDGLPPQNPISTPGHGAWPPEPR